MACRQRRLDWNLCTPSQHNKLYWNLNLYQSALPSIHVWVIEEEFVILYTEFKWRIGVHFGQNAAKNNNLLKKRFK